MAKYSKFKYGAAKYGATTSNQLIWGFEVDWDNDGYFSGENEAPYMSRLTVVRGRNDQFRADGGGLEPVKPGTFTAVMEDVDGRFDPYNTSSPLYPNVAPGREFRIRVRDDSTGTIYPVIAGRITDIRPADLNKRVVITGVDPLQHLIDANKHYFLSGKAWEWPLLTLIADMNLAAQPLSNIDFEAGTDFTVWWAEGASRKSYVDELMDASLGRFFVNADGAFTYYPSDYTGYDAIIINQSDVLKDIRRTQPWETVRNHFEVVCNARSLQATTLETWKLSEVTAIGASASVSFIGYSTYNGAPAPFGSYTTPVATTDYTVFANADGSGTNLTANFSVTVSTFGGASYGTSFTITVTNNAATPGYITFLRLRTFPYLTSKVTSVRDDTTSQTAYGIRAMKWDNRMVQTTVKSDGLAVALKTLLSTPRTVPGVKIEARPSLQFGLDLFDRVNLNLPEVNLSGIYDVGYIRHEWLSGNGQATLTEIQLEPALNLSDSLWIFTTELETNSYFG